MLLHPTLDKLNALYLTGMAAALEEQSRLNIGETMSFEERLGLLVDREMTERANKALTNRLKNARLRQNAVCEDIDFQHVRGLDRSLIVSLLGCKWIRRHDNCLITGPTGVGKSFLACALANKACREGCSVSYARMPRLMADLAIARADGSYSRKLAALAKCDLIVLDDFGLAPMTREHARDLLEILDDRYDRRSTLVASQLTVDVWHQAIGDPTLADAALDRLVHNAHRLALNGESLRKTRGGNRHIQGLPEAPLRPEGPAKTLSFEEVAPPKGAFGPTDDTDDPIRQ